VAGARGPVREIVTDPAYLDVSLPAATSFTHPVTAGHTVFAFVVEGEGWFDAARDPFSCEATGESWWDTKQPCVCGAETLVLSGPGSAVQMAADRKPVRFLLVSGKPLKEPAAWYGSIVMNTREELTIAFQEFERGTFVKPTGHRARDVGP
jgi:redox-sensitive bicupin YhaK (pirin superfamily)